MAFIPINIAYTTQSDFQGPSVSSSNVDTTTRPGSVLLEQGVTSNIQVLDSSNDFKGTLSANLEITDNKVTLKPFITRLINIVPPRTTTVSEDYLTLPYTPLEEISLVVKANGLTLALGVDYSYTANNSRVNLITSFSPSTSFETSFLSDGILACEGELETDTISVGSGASLLELDNVGTNLESTQIWIKVAETIDELTSSSWNLISGQSYNLALNDKFIKLKFIFIPESFESITFPVTFKYIEDWNLPGSIFDNVVLNATQNIEIISGNNNSIPVTSLPVPTTFAGADFFKDTSTDDNYLVVVGGLEGSTTASKSVRMAKINPDHSLEKWVTLNPVPNASVPYNGTKVCRINGVNYLYSLNNNNSSNIYKNTINQGGSGIWNTQVPLPVAVEKANLEIISNTLTSSNFLLVQDQEHLYWALLNNTNGSIVSDHWNSFNLPEKQRASATAIVPCSTDSNKWFLYILGGSLGREIQNTNTNLITKVTITQSGMDLVFSSEILSVHMPVKLSHFTAEIIEFNSSQYLYTFGGSNTSEAFSDRAISTIYRIGIDLSTGNFTESSFSISPNKLYTGSSGLNTIAVKQNSNIYTYVIGDSARASSRVSYLNIVETSTAIRTGVFTSGIFAVPGCDIQFGNLSYNISLRNSNQSIVAKYRAAETETALSSASFIAISNNSPITANPTDKFIQFEFDLAKSIGGSSTELSPVLNSFSFNFTSNISDLSTKPELLSSTLTFDNNIYSQTGDIILRFDSMDSNTEYTALSVGVDTSITNENTEVFYRTGNLFPITTAFNPLSDFSMTTVTGRYIETKIMLNSSSDNLFTPSLNDVTISGIQPQYVGDRVDQFIYHEAPVGDQDQINTHYITDKAFVAGSLQVFVNGIEQLPGLAYTEGLDMESFDFISYAPDSLDSIFINYIKPL